MRHRLFIAFCTLFIVTIIACQDDEENLYDEPAVKMNLYNQDSLVQLTDSIKRIDTLLKYNGEILDSYQDSAGLVLDSIIKVEVLINSGVDTLDLVLADLDTQLLYYNDVYDQYYTLDTIARNDKKAMTATSNTIKSGLVWISSITNNKNGLSIDYENSATVWPLPLSNTEDDVSLVMVIDSISYNIQVTYERTVTVNEFNNVVMQASKVTVVSHDFDSLKVKCATPECIDYETTIDIYF